MWTSFLLQDTLHQMLTTCAILMHLGESISELISTSSKQLNYWLYPKTRILPHSTISERRSTISERRQRKKTCVCNWTSIDSLVVCMLSLFNDKVHNTIWECINNGIDCWNSGIPEWCSGISKFNISIYIQISTTPPRKSKKCDSSWSLFF